MSVRTVANSAILYLLILGFISGCGAYDAGKLQSSLPADTPTPTPDPTGFAKDGHLIRSYQLDELKKLGLKDPIPEIVESLRSNPKIIPFEGVLGGTMGFYGEENIHVLSTKWVYARFDDGHILGDGVFEYTIKKGGTLEWKVIKAQLEE